MKIDSHQHFWNFEKEKHNWINDDMAVLKRDFAPSDLKLCLEETGIGGCIAVQADQKEEETNFLLELSNANDFIKGIVGWVDLRAENIAERLKHYAQFEKLSGFRHVVQDEQDPNFMLGEAFQRGMSLLKDYGFTYDILIFPTQLEAALETVKRHSDQKFVIDHIAKPYIKEGKIDEWATYMRQIAAHDHVMCKVSGMVTEADWTEWKYEDFVSYMDVVVETFGVDRLMYGSDWPVCLLGGDYKEVKSIPDRYFEKFSKEEQEKIFGKNAVDFYGIK
ncbi:MAG: amidohydrolase family protein [Reichenbachiella sp.]